LLFLSASLFAASSSKKSTATPLAENGRTMCSWKCTEVEVNVYKWVIQQQCTAGQSCEPIPVECEKVIAGDIEPSMCH
jgi:hypothetical protein